MFARRTSSLAWLLISILSFAPASHAAEPKPAQAGGAKPYEKQQIDGDPIATSLLELYAGQEGEAPLAVLRKTHEPPHPGGDNRLPILAREICRQALLTAARDGLRWTTRDEAIGEIFEAAADAKPRRLLLTMRFPPKGPAEFSLKQLGDDHDAEKAPAAWSAEIQLQDGPESLLDYRRLAQAADKWSREVFPDFLKSGDAQGSANKITQATVADDVIERLENMNHSEQFAALRLLHRAVREEGESPALVGALIRGYANLGVLTEFHWTAAHKAFKARALVYAARLAANTPASGWALWHRAYAEALAGLHRMALDDLAQAQKLSEQSGGDKTNRPAWVDVIDHFCRFQTDRLTEATADNHVGQLAALLRYLHVESFMTSAQTINVARESLDLAPDCFRIYDSVCEQGGIATLHWATQFSLDRLFTSFPDDVRAMPGKPKSVTALLKNRGDEAAGAVEVAEALIDAGKTDSVHDEMSWTVLGRLTRETAFAQFRRRLRFMRFQWSVPLDGTLPVVLELMKKHRYVAFLETYGAFGDEAEEPMNRFADAFDMSEIDQWQRFSINRAAFKPWLNVRVNQHLAAWGAANAHDDDTYGDLASGVRLRTDSRQAMDARRLWQVSPHGAAGPAALIAYDANSAAPHLDEWEKEHAAHAAVLSALASHYLKSKQQANAERCLHAYIAVSPDGWAYRALAKGYQAQNKIDEWLKTLNGFLEQEEFGLEHAQTRVEIANFFMQRKEFERAKPYAEAAAESWAEWAMLCAVRCDQGLLDEEQEGIWLGRLLERYPSRNHAVHYFYWCHRTGLGDADAAMQILEPYLTPGKNNGSTADPAFVYQMAGRRREALEAFEAQTKDKAADPQTRQFLLGYEVTLALELGEMERAGEALDAVIARGDSYSKVAVLYKTFHDGEDEAKFDVDEIHRILQNRSPAAQVNISWFAARLLEIAGQKPEAIEFYRFAATVPGTHLNISHCLARQALRRLGAPLDAAALKAAIAKATAEKTADKQNPEQQENKAAP